MPREGLAGRRFRLARAAAAFSVVVGLAGYALAQTDSREIGGDLFIIGSQPAEDVDTARDAFIAGPSVALRGAVAEDVHAAGFSVEVEAETRGDLYAAGATVSVRATVSDDLTVSGGSVRIHPDSRIGGNARVFGGTIAIEGPVAGSLVASGGEILLDAAVDGDVWLVAPSIRLGPNARVGGELHYSSTGRIVVPDGVAAPDRVFYEELDAGEVWRTARESWQVPEVPNREMGAAAAAGGLAVTIGFAVVVGACFLAFAPALVARLEASVAERPGISAILGVVGLALVFGLVPILVLTIVGLPLVPFVLLAILLVWTLGYILGAFAVGMGLARALGGAPDPSILLRLAILAVAVFVAALLNFVPFIGWMANFALVLLGVGAITAALFERFMPATA